MGLNGDGLYEQVRTDKGWEYKFPDQLSFQKEPFATVIPSRSVTFKVHKTEGLANSALSNNGQGAKYKQENGVWVKVWEFYEPTNCEKCSAPLGDQDKKTDYYGRMYSGIRGYLRSPLHKGSQIFAPFLCRNCYDEEEAVVNDRLKAKQWREEQRRKANN